jgi:hypothetical protein
MSSEKSNTGAQILARRRDLRNVPILAIAPCAVNDGFKNIIGTTTVSTSQKKCRDQLCDIDATQESIRTSQIVCRLHTLIAASDQSNHAFSEETFFSVIMTTRDRVVIPGHY